MATRSTASLVVCCTILVPTAAVAAPAFTATNLGTSSAGINFTPNRNDLPADWAQAPGGVPAVVSAPYFPGGSISGYSNSILYDMNANGLAVGIDDYGANGLGYHIASSEMFTVQRQSDGAWANAQELWAGTTSNQPGASFLTVGGISNTGLIVGAGPMYPALTEPGSPQQWWLYDSRSESLTKLDALLPGSQWLIQSASIDADGRILVQVFSKVVDLSKPDYFLLTPTDVAAPTPVPEPTALPLFVAALGAAALGRRKSLMK